MVSKRAPKVGEGMQSCGKLRGRATFTQVSAHPHPRPTPPRCTPLPAPTPWLCVRLAARQHAALPAPTPRAHPLWPWPCTLCTCPLPAHPTSHRTCTSGLRPVRLGAHRPLGASAHRPRPRPGSASFFVLRLTYTCTTWYMSDAGADSRSPQAAPSPVATQARRWLSPRRRERGYPPMCV